MKKVLLIAVAFPLIIIGFAFNQANPTTESNQDEINIPEQVQVVLDKSCMPCHSDEGKGLKSKSKLNFDKLNSLEPTKKVSKLLEIAEEVKDEKMPKSGFIKKHPEAALTPETSTLLIEWAEKQAEDIVQK